jgi:UDP-N-acetylmuramoyl-L-alanyl-D-glutamate--2,6-diaminopimelate ligase
MDIPAVIAGGDRHEDIALRLKVAGIPEDKLIETADLTDVIEKIKLLPTEHVYILATYTAVLQLRKELAQKGYIDGGMDRG